MVEYIIIETPEFVKQFHKLPLPVQERFIRQLEDARRDPFHKGKPLGRSWFRELKQGKFRLYYLIAERKLFVLLVRVSEKKHQEETITYIRKELETLIAFLNEKANHISNEKHPSYDGRKNAP